MLPISQKGRNIRPHQTTFWWPNGFVRARRYSRCPSAEKTTSVKQKWTSNNLKKLKYIPVEEEPRICAPVHAVAYFWEWFSFAFEGHLYSGKWKRKHTHPKKKRWMQIKYNPNYLSYPHSTVNCWKKNRNISSDTFYWINCQCDRWWWVYFIWLTDFHTYAKTVWLKITL